MMRVSKQQLDKETETERRWNSMKEIEEWRETDEKRGYMKENVNRHHLYIEKVSANFKRTKK
jgi:hypothetical protein